MSRHLPILMAMFPGVVMLNADQIASITGYSKGTIYNMVSAKTLPVKVAVGLGDRILVSIVEMAAYMDRTMLSDNGSVQDPQPESVPVKKGVGRPRGTTKAVLQARCFQSELRAALYQYEFKGILVELRQESEGVRLISDDKYSCMERLQQAKTDMLHNVGRAEAQFDEIELELISRRV